jgi:hypothetical protein
LLKVGAGAGEWERERGRGRRGGEEERRRGGAEEGLEGIRVWCLGDCRGQEEEGKMGDMAVKMVEGIMPLIEIMDKNQWGFSLFDAGSWAYSVNPLAFPHPTMRSPLSLSLARSPPSFPRMHDLLFRFLSHW